MKYLVSFEFVFMLFMFSGELKESEYINETYFGLDLSAYILFVNLIQFYFIIFSDKVKYKFKSDQIIELSLIIIWGVYISFSFFLTETNAIASRKYLEFIVIIGWTVVGAIVISSNIKRVSLFIKLNLIFGFILSLFNLIFLFSTETVTGGLSGGLGEGYHRLGRASGAAILLTYVFYRLNKFPYGKYFLFFLVTICIYGMISSGHRASIVVLPLSIAFFEFFTNSKFKISKLKFRYLILVVSLIVVFIAYSTQGQYLINRFILLPQTAGSLERLMFYEASFPLILDNPIFGVGFGNFSSAANLPGYRHPHNFLIEVILELGVIGFILTAIITLHFTIKKTQYGILQASLIALLIFYLLNSLIGGNITDNRMMFSIIFVLNLYILKK